MPHASENTGARHDGAATKETASSQVSGKEVAAERGTEATDDSDGYEFSRSDVGSIVEIDCGEVGAGFRVILASESAYMWECEIAHL